MNQVDFTTAFLNALTDSRVLTKIEECIGASLKHDINSIKDSQEKLSQSIRQLNEKCTQLQNENKLLHDAIKKRDEKITILENEIETLKVHVDNFEQQDKMCNLRFTGVKEVTNESTESVVTELINTTLKVQLDKTTIEKAYRVGSASGTSQVRPILVRFKTLKDRDTVYRSRQQLNKSESKYIFINEDLTASRAKLFHSARQLKKTRKINDCWTWNCNILVKDKSNKIHKISKPENLQQF